MKKLLVLLFFIVFAAYSFAQKASLSKDEYSEKSKKQKGTAWALVCVGVPLILLGNLVGNSKKSSFSDAAVGVVIGGSGVILVLLSIPTFIASGNNKQRALSMALKNEIVPMPENSHFKKTNCPSVSFRLRL